VSRRWDNAPHSGNFRIIYRYDPSGTSFKVQEERGRNWIVVDGFPTLHHAVAGYPEAQVSESAEDEQLRLETRPHGFERENRGGDLCHHCGRSLNEGQHVARQEAV
jgi:hypothetical protein